MLSNQACARLNRSRSAFSGRTRLFGGKGISICRCLASARYMGKTERISSHCACLALSGFGGAGKFNVVIVLFTAASSIRRGLLETVPRLLCDLPHTATQSPWPPRDVLHLVPALRDPRIPAANSKGKWRIPPCRTPAPCVPAISPARAGAASLAPENGRRVVLERTGRVVPRIPVHP